MSEKKAASIHIVDVKRDNDEEKSIDTATGSQPPISLDDIEPQMEAKIRLEYDLRVLPIAILIYLMSFIDR